MFRILLNKNKKIIMMFLFVSTLFISINVFASSNYTINVNTGVGSNTGYEPNKSSYWRHGAQQGIRISLVYNETKVINGRRYLPGDKVINSISMDYTELTNIGHYRSYSPKFSKLQHLNSGLSSLNDFSSSGYVYKKLPVSLPTFVYTGTGTNSISRDVLYKYFEDNYLIKTDSVKSINYAPVDNLVTLLSDLNAPTSMINDLLASAKCIYEKNCPKIFSDMKEKYNFALIIEPVGFFYFEKNNRKYDIAATPTELGKVFPLASNAGFAGGATHRNIPKSIYLSSNEFGGRLTAVSGDALTRVLSSGRGSYMTGSEMSSNLGLGVGVITLWDEVKEDDEIVKVIPCTPKVSCQNGICDDITKPSTSVYKDDDNWECIMGSKGTTNDMSAAGIGNAYCPVFCRENITTSFPKPTDELIVGTKFSFEPISLSSSKECRTEVDLTSWRDDYKDANDDALVAYKNWKTEQSKQAAWSNKKDIDACTTSPEFKIVKGPEAPTSASCSSTLLLDSVRVEYNGVPTSNFRFVFPSNLIASNYTCNLDGQSLKSAKEQLSSGFYQWSEQTVQQGLTKYIVTNRFTKDSSEFYNFKKPDNVTCFGEYELKAIENSGEIISSPGDPVSFVYWKEFNGVNKCVIETAVEVESVARKYEYTYTDYTGSSNRSVKVQSCTAPTNRIASSESRFNTAFNLISSYENSLRECSTWNTAYNQDPILKAVQTQTVKNNLITNEYDLITSKVESNSVPKTVICDDSTLCNSNTIVKYNFNLDRYSYSNVGFASTKIPLVKKVADSRTFRFDFTLKPEVNRFSLIPSGLYVNSVPEEYKTGAFAGAYKDTGFPGFVIRLDADDKKGGTVSIKYKNIGEGGKFDSCLNKDALGFGAYACPYEFKSPGCVTNCDSLVNIIYRPIDLSSPFAAWDGRNREPGYNWRYEPEIDLVDMFITNNRGVKTEDVYKLEPMYEIDFTGVNKFMINEIRNYNKKHSYDYFPITCNEGKECRSTFLRKELKDIVSGCGTEGNWTACEGVDR